MKLRWLIVLGLVAFLITLVGAAPAANLWQWFKPEGIAVELDGLDGTLSHGRVATVSAGGRPLAGPLEWRLQPLWLLLAKVSVSLRSEGDVNGQGHLRISPLGALSVSDLELEAALPDVLRNSGYGYLPIDGRFSLDLRALDLAGRLPTAIDGQLDLRSLQWKFGRTPLALGSFRAILSTEGRTQHAAISTVDGTLDVSGEGTLDAEGAYDLHLQLKAKPGTEPQLQNLLRGLGRPDNQGYYHFRTRGTAKP